MKRLLLFVLTVNLLGAPAPAQQPVPEIPYESVPNFLKLPLGMNFGEMQTVSVNSKGHIFLLSRSNLSGPAFGQLASQAMEFDQTGKFLREVGKGLYSASVGHGIRIDKEDNIWLADRGSDTIVKLNPEGYVVMVLGRRVEASSPAGQAPLPTPNPPAPASVGQFRGPANVAFDDSGNIYVADGYVNSRVAKFDKNGVPLRSWGERGTEPGQFNVLHDIAVDKAGNVYIADRGNVRIQVFDTDGKFLRIIRMADGIPVPPGSRDPFGDLLNSIPTTGQNAPGAPQAVCITPGPTQYLYASDRFPGRIYKMTLDGKVVGVFGKWGKQLGEFSWIHGLACPSENELYVAELVNWRVQKLILHPAKNTSSAANR